MLEDLWWSGVSDPVMSAAQQEGNLLKAKHPNTPSGHTPRRGVVLLNTNPGSVSAVLSCFLTPVCPQVSKIAAYAYSAISQIKVDAKEDLVVQFAIP